MQRVSHNIEDHLPTPAIVNSDDEQIAAKNPLGSLYHPLQYLFIFSDQLPYQTVMQKVKMLSTKHLNECDED